MRNGLHSKSHQLPELYFSEWEEEGSHGHQFEKFDLDIEMLAATFQFPSLYSTGSRSGKTVHIKNLRSQKYRLREEIPVFFGGGKRFYSGDLV